MISPTAKISTAPIKLGMKAKVLLVSSRTGSSTRVSPNGCSASMMPISRTSQKVMSPIRPPRVLPGSAS